MKFYMFIGYIFHSLWIMFALIIRIKLFLIAWTRSD